VKDGFREARKGITEETKKLMEEWSKKDFEDFTEYLYKNRQKDRRGKMTKAMKVSKEKFDAYRVVQDSGITNMMAVKTVIIAADDFCDVTLTREDCFYIMKNYAALKKEYK